MSIRRIVTAGVSKCRPTQEFACYQTCKKTARLRELRAGSKLWAMKLRLDLLEHLTKEDILEEVLANNHRYKPEPNFSKTGVGTLSSASIKERAQEEERSTALIKRLKKRAKQSGD